MSLSVLAENYKVYSRNDSYLQECPQGPVVQNGIVAKLALSVILEISPSVKSSFSFS
jgi:hypothetical protein